MNTRQFQILEQFSKDLTEMEDKIKKMKATIEGLLASDHRILIPCAEYSFTPNPPK